MKSLLNKKEVVAGVEEGGESQKKEGVRKDSGSEAEEVVGVEERGEDVDSDDASEWKNGECFEAKGDKTDLNQREPKPENDAETER